ncbi:hypothetical protein HMPREF0758_2864 [Serratia odorifera DSM 4582]|uniref:Uncharacterized protein n=1 Tax=Serratia odorifera DSM 4582 TaxID=667129 RepID=D4E3W4_SEROD|nr:hypothetical protein HMPREF0758_2864 [Serratia odorifera DSM 4582]
MTIGVKPVSWLALRRGNRGVSIINQGVKHMFMTAAQMVMFKQCKIMAMEK